MKRRIRIFSLILVLILLIASAFTGNAVSASKENYDTLDVKAATLYSEAFEVLKHTNEVRAEKGLQPLTMDKELLGVAMQRAAETAVYYSHTRPDGRSCSSACVRFGGENIVAGSRNAAAAVDAWKNSPGHYANMMRSDIRTVGIGAVKHNGIIYWVQYFGFDSVETANPVLDVEKIYNISVDEEFIELSIAASEKIYVNESCTLEVVGINQSEKHQNEYHVEKSCFDFSSDNPDILSVDGDTITAHKPGKATITAKNAAFEVALDFDIEYYSGDIENSGENSTSWIYDRGVLTISGSGGMCDFEYDDVPWQERIDRINKVVIEEGITNTGSYSFSNMPNLTEVILPESLTEIGEGAFNDCKSLTEVSLPENITGIGDLAFMGCDNLEKVSLSDNLSIVGNEAFRNCCTLNDISLPDSLEEIGEYAFSECDSLKEITLTDNLKIIGEGAFSGCDNLSEITLPGSLNEIGKYVFSECGSLSEVVFSQGLTETGDFIFSDCHSLVDVLLPESIAKISEGSFKGCASLREISLPEGLTEIGSEAFEGCVEIVGFSLPEGLAVIGGYAFSDCVKIEEMVIPSSVTQFGVGVFSGCTNLSKVVLPESTDEIMAASFENCVSLREYEIPESVEYIGENAFRCSGIEKIHIPYEVKDIRLGAFSGCENLKEITADNMSFYTVDDVLYRKEQVWHTSDGVVVTGEKLVAYPAGKENEVYTIPENITDCDWHAFLNCNNLKTLNIHAKVEGLPFFNEPSSIANINIEKGHPLHSSVDGILYNPAGNMLNIYPIGRIDEKYTTSEGVNQINNGAFSGNPYLKEIIVSDGVESIGNNAIKYCEQLETLHIPASVTKIGSDFLVGCENMKDIYFGGTMEQWKAIATIVWSGERVVCSDGVIVLRGGEEDPTEPENTEPENTEPENTEPTESVSIPELVEPVYSVPVVTFPEETTASAFVTDPTEEKTETTASEPEEYALGDVNMDNKLNIRDVTAIQKDLAMIEPLSEEGLDLADFDANGKVNIKDATGIQKRIAGIL